MGYLVKKKSTSPLSPPPFTVVPTRSWGTGAKERHPHNPHCRAKKTWAHFAFRSSHHQAMHATQNVYWPACCPFSPGCPMPLHPPVLSRGGHVQREDGRIWQRAWPGSTLTEPTCSPHGSHALPTVVAVDNAIQCAWTHLPYPAPLLAAPMPLAPARSHPPALPRGGHVEGEEAV